MQVLWLQEINGDIVEDAYWQGNAWQINLAMLDTILKTVNMKTSNRKQLVAPSY